MDFSGRVGAFIETRGRLISIITLLMLIPALIGIMQLESDFSVEVMISTSSDEYQAFDRFTDAFSGATIIVMVESENLDDLIAPENIAAMVSIEDRLNPHPLVMGAIGPGFLIQREAMFQTGEATVPTDGQILRELIVDPETGGVREALQLVFPDNQHALIVVNLDGSVDMDDALDMVDVIQDAVDQTEFSDTVTPIVTGEPAMTKGSQETQGETMGKLIWICIGLMLAILAIIFRVRNHFAWRWLPLGSVLIGVVWTLGIMGFIGMSVTVVTTSAIPVLIGLGADYAIQFHNRYDEEVRRGKTFSEAVIQSVKSIGSAVGIAIVVACLGFAGLFFSSVPMVQDFGATLIIGVICCYIISLGFMVAVLYWNDRRKGAVSINRDITASVTESETAHGFVERGLSWLAPKALGRPAIIIPIAVILAVTGIILDRDIESESDLAKFSSSDLDYMQDLKKLEDVVGGRQTASVFIRADDVTDPEVMTWMAGLEQKIGQEQEGIVHSTTSMIGLIASVTGGAIPETNADARGILEFIPSIIKRNYVNEDFTAAHLEVGVRVMNSDEIQQFKTDMDSYVTDLPEGVSADVTGIIILQDKMVDGLTTGREKITILGIIFVFCGLLVLYRLRWVKALMASLPIILIVGWSAIVMYVAGIDYTPVTATLGALIVGIGVEFTILLMERYYEEKGKGQPAAEAMTTAMTKIGRAIIASGMTVIGGFAALLMAFDFPILQDFGAVTMINVVFALFSTLVVLPPLIVWVETKLPVGMTRA